jgi:hypothetical protein
MMRGRRLSLYLPHLAICRCYFFFIYVIFCCCFQLEEDMFQKHFGSATGDDFGLAAVGPFAQLADSPVHHNQELQCGGGGGDPFQSTQVGDHHGERFLGSPTDMKNANMDTGINDQFGSDHLVLNGGSGGGTNGGDVGMDENEYQTPPPPATPAASGTGDEDYMYSTHCHSNLEVIKVKTCFLILAF